MCNGLCNMFLNEAADSLQIAPNKHCIYLNPQVIALTKEVV